MTDLDMAKLGDFQKQMAGFMNAGGAVLMISVGHRAGLFDAMAGLAPSTSAEVATAADLDERYVREWLAAMATAGVVKYNRNADTFTLPPEHAALTTRAAGPANMARLMQFIPLLATVEDQIVDKFHNGGGVPYSEFGDFHRLMAEISGAQFDAGLVSHVLPLVPGLLDALETGVEVADVGTGSGHAVNVMAAAFPESTFVGYDFSEAAIATAVAEAESMGLSNAEFVVKDAATLDSSRQFDYVTTFDAVHDQAHPRAMVKGIFQALKPGGYWLCSDIRASSHVGENLGHPVGTFEYAVSCMHCMTVSLAYDGEGLGAMWGVQKAREIFTEAGFGEIVVSSLDMDPANNYYVCRRGA